MKRKENDTEMFMRVERQLIKPSHKQWKSVDSLCFLSKNLFNRANYIIRQEFEQNKRWIRYIELDGILKNVDDPDYRALPNNSSQQLLLLLDKSWKGFFASVRSYKKTPTKFKAVPRMPSYKAKQKGRNVVVFTYTQCKIKDGFIHFPKKSGISPIKTGVEGSLKQVRIVPLRTGFYQIETVYEQPKKPKPKTRQTKKHAGIDLGINNLMTLVTSDMADRPIIVNGRSLKSVNQQFNRSKAYFQSKLPKDQKMSKRIRLLTQKRNNRILDKLHKASRKVVNWCIFNEITDVIIGLNKGWKQESNIGKRNNQNFVTIPHSLLIEKLRYKLEEHGISLTVREESYTSKCSFLDLEPMQKREVYQGNRVKRGLFESSSKRRINADVNGAFNILRKELGDVPFSGMVADAGQRHCPTRINV